MGKWMQRTAGLIAVALLLAGGLHAGPPAEPGKTGDQPAALDEKALAELALEHSRTRDALSAVEARLALLAESLYAARLVIHYRGELDRPFSLHSVEMRLDGALAYHKEFDRAASAQALKVFDGFLPPGRHTVEVRIQARGPDGTQDDLPAYSAASGMAVHMREGAVTRLIFEAEQDGQAPQADELRSNEPEGSWDVDIQAAFVTEP
jgi:hypothetical protein